VAGPARKESGVKHPWAIYIAKEDGATLAALRLFEAIEVGEREGEIWLRGRAGSEALDTKLAALPALERFEWLATNRLRRIDQRVPSGTLPELAWKPIATWTQVRMPLAALPAEPPAKAKLVLTRSTVERDASLLVTSLEEFQNFCASAAAIRLNPLRFAANANGEVLVKGAPLPPLPGQRFVLHGRIAAPAGFAWRPEVSVEVLERCFGVSGDAMILWHEDGTMTRLHSEQFIPVTRNAVRATAEALKEPP
jgi:hypothetical protein